MTDHRQQCDKPGFLARVGRVLYRMFFMIGIAAAISVVCLTVTVSRMLNYAPPPLPDNIMLTYTFKEGLGEDITKPSLDQPLLRPATTMHEIVTAIRDAAGDPRVKGFAAKIENMSLSTAQVQELRDALAVFRAAGKPAYVFSTGFGGFSAGTGDYYLASAFDKIWLQPVGMVAVTGISAEVPFAREILDKAGINPQFAHQGKYKSGPESFTETAMSAAHREMMVSLITDLSDQLTADIAQSRSMDVAAFRALVNRAPFADKEALAEKLVDHIGYYDEMLDQARTITGLAKGTPHADKPTEKQAAEKPDSKSADPARSDVVDLLGYSFLSSTTEMQRGMPGFVTKFARKEAPPSTYRNQARIALIYGSGNIVAYRGKSGFGEGGMAADKIAAAFRAARNDKDVAAVIFRIDTPGGSPEASETIRRAMTETRKAGKPVIVSMSSYAASGGYWIATGADKIVAQPGTITGSIGVFGGKFSLAALWDKLGVNWESVSVGDNASMFSPNRPFSAAELARFEALLGNIYESFLDRVMEARKMTRAEAIAVAEGRIFTGRQAKEKNLVDELGGLDRAVVLARAAAKIPAEQEVAIVRFPPRKTTLEMFISLATEGALFQPRIDLSLRDVMQQAEIFAQEQGDVLTAPSLRLR